MVDAVDCPMEEATGKRRLVLVSHGGADSWVARQIEREIRGASAEAFLDEANIGVGEDFPEMIRAALQRADELLVLFTPWSVRRPWVWVEVGAAFQRGILIVGVLHGLSSEELRSDTSIPVFLLERNLINLNDIQRYFDQLQRRIDDQREETT